MPLRPLARSLYRWITGESDPDGCKDISEAACREQPGNFGLQLLAKAGSKLADELASVRLVLPWVLGTLGSPLWMVGWLVPIRDGCALLPQLLVGAWVRSRRRRIVAWWVGGALQGLAAAGMAWVVWSGFATGVVSGWVVLGLLTLLSLARGLSSIASKDVLGKTIAKDRRGSLNGWAGGVASGVGMAVGLLLSLDLISGGEGDRPDAVILALLLAGAALGWGFSALCVAVIREEPGDVDADKGALETLREGLAELRRDRDFLWFNLARTAALGSALALPYLAVLSREQSGTALKDLGVLVVAGGIGGMVSSPVWGRFADSASHKVLAAGALGAGLCAFMAAATVWLPEDLRASVWPYALIYTLALMAHGGIRLGRKTHVVNIANQDNRALLVATSNSFIGLIFLPVGAAVGALAPWLGVPGLLLVLGGMSLLAAGMAWRLKSAEAD